MTQDQYYNKLVGGLNLDSYPTEVQNTEWTFLQNGVLEEDDGDVLKVQTEPGNELITNTPYPIIGVRPIGRKQKILFSTDNSNCEVGLLDNDVYSTIINDSDLNFKSNRIVKAEFKIKNGCERIIYFYDFYNPDRVINLDRLDQYKDDNDEWVIDRLKLNPDITLPQVINLQVQQDNGSLKAGLYQFAIELLDEDLNSAGFGPISNPVSIYSDRLNDNYRAITGAANLTDTDAEDGGVPLINKSIQVSIKDLDTNFRYARVWVIEKSSTEGLATNVYQKSDLIQIQEPTYSYTFTGIKSTDTTGDIEQIIVRNAYYERSKVMAQVDNRLVRSNLKSETRDYSQYQRLANSITSQWVKRQVTPFNIDTVGTSRNPNTYFDSVGFMGDEVYAFAIQYVFKSGQLSPAFHIPGREKDTNDSITYTIGTDIDKSEVRHLGLEVGDIEKWKVYNTASLTGNMAYHESVSGTYPLTKDCNDEYIYGDDLAGQPVRHHRFPDRRKVPVYDGQFEDIKLNILGIEFDNVTYPDTDIVGHRFLMVPRTDENKTVLDNGIICGGRTVNGRYEYVKLEQPAFAGSPNVFFWSPETLINRKYLNGSYFTFNGYINSTNLTEERSEFDKSGGGSFDIRTMRYKGLLGFTLPAKTNVAYSKNLLVDPQSIIYTDTAAEGATGVGVSNSVFNNSFVNTVNYYKLDDSFNEGNSSLLNVSNKKITDSYSNVSNLIYNPITDIRNLDNTVYNGDTFISEFSLLDLFNRSTTGNRILYFGTHLSNTWVESQINYELIHGGLDGNLRYNYPNGYGDYWINKVATATTSDYVEKAAPDYEYYGYNKNYSFINNPESSVSLPLTYNYCSECKDEYPNRIIWSEKTFSEEVSDGYRIFKVNNFVSLGQNKGEITALHYDKNRILVRTKEARFQLAPNPQVLNSDQDTVYIGTGDFLSIPPNELISVEYGYAGGTGKLDEINTEFGLVSVDEEAGQIIWITRGIKELTSKEYKCQKWLRKNLPLVAKQQIPELEDEAYIHLVYDPRYKRLIINKKDFLVNEDRYIGLKSATTQDGLVYSKEDGFQYRIGQIYLKPYQVAGQDFFTDKSWTLSYSMELQKFIGFHTYTDNWLFENDQKLYFSDNKDILKQSDSNYTTFSSTKDNFIVEIVITKPQTVDLEQVLYYASSSNDDTNVVYPTFDTMWIYNSDQSTGLQVLDAKTDYNFKWSNTNKPISFTEKNYRINKIVDLSTNNTITNNSILDKQPLNIDYTKDQRFLIPMKDKWFKVRFYFKPDTDTKLIYDFVQTILRNSEL